MRNHQNYQTALGAKLSDKLGMDARDVRFSVALSEFFNHGGTVERAYELVALAAERMGKSAIDVLPEGQADSADVPRIDAAKGHGSCADKADSHVPDAATQRSAGQGRSADEATYPLPDASPATPRYYHLGKPHPKRNPGHAKRGIAAIQAVQETVSRSLFDTYKLPGDGRAIGDITWKELQGLARKHAEAYRLLTLIDSHGVPADPNVMVREVLKEETLKEFIEFARLSNVH